VQEYVQPSPLYTHVQLHVQTQDVQVLGLRHRPQQYADTPLATSAPNKANPKAPHAEAAVCRKPLRVANAVSPSTSFACVLSS